MKARDSRYDLLRERFRRQGKPRFVRGVAAVWFLLIGLAPLPSLLRHAVLPEILPLVLACVAVLGVLVAHVAWSFMGCDHPAGPDDTPGRDATMRRLVSRYLMLPFAVSLACWFFGPADSLGATGVVCATLVVLAGASLLLVHFVRATKHLA